MLAVVSDIGVGSAVVFGSTFGEELGVTPDDPADTGVDEAVLVAGNVD
jgi:hypothetical protein